jgi:hypothetical protein
MHKHSNFNITFIFAAVLTLSATHALAMTKAEYSAGKTRISADYKTDKAACASMTGNTKDVCIEEAKAKEKVALAELKFSDSGKPADQTKVAEAKAESAYAVAKEKCDDQKSNAKDVCVKEAKAIEIKALVNARMGKEITETKMDGAQDKRDADYKVAAEKCDTLAADAKTNCMTAAKTKFGKM